MKHLLLFLGGLFSTLPVLGQVKVLVNLNVAHQVDSVSAFNRSKFITIHAEQTENEWQRDNFTPDLLDDFLNGYDVYLGRNTGGVSWNLNQVQQDPSRPGFADPADIASRGLNFRNNYAPNTNLHTYDKRKNLVIGGQLHPFWTGEGQKATGQGWRLANATATGEYMGRYIKEFYGNNGPSAPAFVEIINEPAYESLGGFSNYTGSIQEIADFHVEVADAIRTQLPDIKIGGYTTAFPNFEIGNFQRWENRWKRFMDVAGEKMDFWSIHLYDFTTINGGKVRLRSGSNIEATFDMMEQYSQMSFDYVKPFVISEYGAQMHDYAQQQWSPFRDWLHLKAQNAQLMSFMERPHLIDIAINFLIVKAEWGYWNGVPYNHRLMRRENEPTSYTGDWVYTDMVKFYQLWQNVNGQRVDSRSDDLDIQVEAFVDGGKAYVILNNLHFESTEIDLELIDTYSTELNSVLMRQLTLSGNAPVLEEQTLNEMPSSLQLGAESTIILEYDFQAEVPLDEQVQEVKYYAENYLQPIAANQVIPFQVNGVQKGTFGEGLLRLGLGRAHGKSLQPVVKVNGTTVCVPEDWRGDEQADRASFFGVLEIPIDNNLLLENNTVSVQFDDDGGHVSSVTLQVFSFSKALARPSFCALVPTADPPETGATLAIFPNPTDKVLNYRSDLPTEPAELSIRNLNGQLLWKNKIADSSGTIDTAALPAGIYLLTYQTSEYIHSQKLIIE
ncbi:MAG: T9SS type A sorting domain-containing protein [Saprospiraceae bacterium]|nr:T9SS type A sorting domain-containing protein [Saprospiraceae bacterium]